MFQRSSSPRPATSLATDAALDAPHDTCIRCGRPTPLGVALCEQDNPGRIKGPSATQVHGTIVLGLIAGFVLLAVLLRVASAGIGPFSVDVAGAATRADGGLELLVRVTNNGERVAGASCRVSAGGVPEQGDYVFFTATIAPGATREIAHTVLPRVAGAPLQPGSIAVRCN